MALIAEIYAWKGRSNIGRSTDGWNSAKKREKSLCRNIEIRLHFDGR